MSTSQPRVMVAVGKLPDAETFCAELATLDRGVALVRIKELLPAIARAAPSVQADWKDAFAVKGRHMSKGPFTEHLKAAIGEAREEDWQASKSDEEEKPAHFPGVQEVPGSPGLRYTPGGGLWRGKVQILDWCPTVTRHLGVTGRTGELTRRAVTVVVGKHITTAAISEVAEGKLWREKFTTARGTATREVREALLNLVEDQAANLPVIPALAYWTPGGRLVLPPPDTLPRGYGEIAGTPDDFAELLRVVADAPKVALQLGAAVGGLYIESLSYQPHVWHGYGQGRRGKSTGLYASAAVFGYPGGSAEACGGGVILPWNTTAQGPGTWLRGLGCLPGFRDDLSSAKLGPEARSTLIFGITQGNERDASTRGGLHRESPGGWHGAVFSTGNERLTAGTTNEGLAARIVELAAPMTPTAQVARRIEAAARVAHGHGLAAIAQSGWTPDRFRIERDAAGVELVVADADVERTHGLYMASALAGGRQLAELFHVPAFAAAAFGAAREVLEELTAALGDRGASPGARLLDALSEDMASREGVYPTRSAVADHRPWPRDRGEIVGYDLADDDEPGDVAVLCHQLREVAKRHGIEDADTALSELESSGRLRRGDRKNRARLLRVANRVTRCYVLLFTSTADDSAKATAPSPDELPLSTGTASPAPHAAPSGDGKPPSAETTAGAPDPAATTGTAVGTAVGEACSACSVVGPSCGFGATAEHTSPCVLCGKPTRVLSRCGAPRHGDCRPEGAVSGDEESLEKTATPPRRQTRPTPGPRAVDTPAREVVDPAVELANVTRPIRERWPNAADADITAALDAWHGATNGLRFVSYPGEVGVAALHRLVAANRSMSLPVALDAGGPVEEIIESGDPLRYAEWLTPGVELDGRAVTSLDVNAQYLAASRSVELGDGQPVRYDKPRGGLEELSKLPGYVLLGKKLITRHPAFGTIRAGTWLAMPTVAYLLRDCGVELDAASVVVWHDHGRRLSAWAAKFSDALAALPAGRDLPTTYARGLVKDVYVTFLGGMLRSGRWNKLPRPDWSDQVVTQAEANKLRALDKATAAGAVVLGSWRDAAWFVADDAPHKPGGLTISTQPGKWKVERYSQVTPELAQAYTSGSPVVFRDALNAANTERKAGGVL